jgi:hypothetical protein
VTIFAGLCLTRGHLDSLSPDDLTDVLHERVRFGPIWEYIWPRGIGPRVAEPALMLIDPYPWSAPLEEVRLKKN